MSRLFAIFWDCYDQLSVIILVKFLDKEGWSLESTRKQSAIAVIVMDFETIQTTYLWVFSEIAYMYQYVTN